MRTVNVMDETAQAAQSIASFLQVFTSNGGLRLRFRVKVRGARLANRDSAAHPEDPSVVQPGGDGPRDLYVEFTGPDTPILTARNGDVLNALEHVATKILRLEADEHDRVSFDADHFKANRDRQMREWAAAAIERVQATGRPHAFPAMSSRERRTLHMVLSESGLPTASSGEGPGRFVVLYPEGADTSAPLAPQRTERRPDASGVRKAFRPR
jgi:spoIIIJ-associated protein